VGLVYNTLHVVLFVVGIPVYFTIDDAPQLRRPPTLYQLPADVCGRHCSYDDNDDDDV